MDARQFLAEFGHISDAPQGVERLRELILSLAFKGDLCPNSSQSADSLLRSIGDQRELLNAETRNQRLTRQDLLLRCSNGPFRIPENWRWASLSTVGHTWGQKKPDGKFSYIDVSSIDNKTGKISSRLELIEPQSAPSRARKIVRTGTIIYSTVRPYLLNIAIIDREFEFEPIASTAFAVVHPWEGVELRYLYHYLRSPWFIKYVEAVQIGMAYPAISDEKFYSGLVPLPSPEEQSHIVAKIDELMALCDTLGGQREAGHKLKVTLRQTTLQAVAASTGPRELQTTWGRLEANFGRLFRSAEDVHHLRDMIFDLALRGTFLPGSLADGFGERSSGKLAPLPIGWEWKPLAKLSECITSGSRGWKAYLANAGDIFIRSQDIRNDALILENPAYVILPEKTEGKRTLVRQYDLLLTITGGNVGKCAVAPNLSNDAYVSQHVALIWLKDPGLSEFIHFWMINAFGGRGLLARYIYGDKPGLNLAQVGSVLIPIPTATAMPKLLDHLRLFQRMCDRLSQQLTDQKTLAAALAAAAIASVAGVAIDHAEEEAVKAPQTELISMLHLGEMPHVRFQAPLAGLLARQHGEMSARDLWQRFGGEIDAFYAQLKAEVDQGWIREPSVAEMLEKQTDSEAA